MQLMEKTKESRGISIHTIKTDRYKTNTLMLMIKAPLDRETVAMRALLPHVLQNGTAQSPSRKEVRGRLDELYGAMLASDVQKKGEQHVITIRLDVANETFLTDQTPLFEEGIKLISEVLLDPLVEENAFNASIVANEKRSLVQRIQSVYDDKMRYANVRITEEMCKNEPFGLTSYGTVEEVEAITAEGLYEYYQQLLKKDRIDLYVVGAMEADEAIAKVETYFNINGREPIDQTPPSSESPKVEKENVVIEEQDVKQGKLHMGYRTYTTYKDDDYVAMQVCNGLFGGFSHSKLFINVREKESLAYYAASRYESHKGVMMVMSGIEFAKYDRAVTIIKEQLEAMCSGDFTKAELDQTKAMLKNQLLETSDVARGYVELSYHQIVSGHNRTLEDLLKEIDQVTKEDVMHAAQKIELDTIYFLKGGEAS
ncbi:insulinase family protein [Alkalihalophilus marmarensis]|jgi:predicted Zn-dependent peptidase|uniref:Zinc protease n=1 Tax=Alkalihalophilus marmarensis DSM 21297 TaxID=1188261 RepID=U6SP52_9BACI|nr:pitrilysin family protein [Alkalihalophilus marmarensis]ERN53363.1 zinc protease [Alkalihalophilus marmarensis DSM 21297]MCM3489520.1 insulinase family protein [Alkalihalophilus marmarensis]